MDGKVVIGTELDTKSFDVQIEQTRQKLNRLENAYEKASKASGKLEVNEQAMANLRVQIEKTRNSLIGLEKKQADLNNTPSNFTEWPKSFNNGLERSIKNVSRLVLGIFGIRGAYMAVRNAMNVITSNDAQLKADIDYMKSAIAYTLEPIIRGIVNLAKQLMFYIGYIIKAWTGKDIFANANKGIKNATSGAKALNKELNKTIAGFDEMNVINDTSSSGGGGGGGASVPSFDLSAGLQGEVPAWLQWIVDNKDIILATLAGIAGALTAIKLGADLITATGIGLIVAGLVLAIEGLLDYLNDPSWENFGQVLQGIGLIVAGLGVIFLGIPGIIAGVLILIVGTIVKYWDEIKAFLFNGIKWLEDSVGAVRDFFGDQVANIYETFITMFKGIIVGFDTTFKGLKQILDGIIQFVTGVFTGNWKQAWEGVKKIFSGIFNALKGIVTTVFSFISGLVVSIAQTVGYTIADAFKAVVNGVLWAIESILNTPIKAVNKLIGVINKIPGINLGTLSTLKLPRLAKGGIINMPGRGIPVGSAIGGERGQEGVIPLTDSQQMALLGEAIGRYITINANITNMMNGRIISRELERIQNDKDFAFNK